MENNNVNQPIFSEDRYKYFKEKGLTDEQIATLEAAESTSVALEDAPEDPKTAFDAINALPDDPAEALSALNKMAEEDPKKFMEIMTVVNAVDMAADDVK